MLQKITIVLVCVLILTLITCSFLNYEIIEYTNDTSDVRFPMFDIFNDVLVLNSEYGEAKEHFTQAFIGVFSLVSFIRILCVIFSEDRISMLVSVTTSIIMDYLLIFIMSLLITESINLTVTSAICVIGILGFFVKSENELVLFEDRSYDGSFNLRDSVRSYIWQIDNYNSSVNNLKEQYNNLI